MTRLTCNKYEMSVANVSNIWLVYALTRLSEIFSSQLTQTITDILQV